MKIGYLMQAGVPDVRRRPLSGAANHVYHVCTELNRLGHHVCVLAYQDNQVWKTTDLRSFDPIIVKGMDSKPFRLFESAVRRIQSELRLPYAGLFESLRFALACRQELDGYDILYERMGWMGYGGGLAARWLDIPWVLEVNGDHLSELEMLGMPVTGTQRRVSISIMQRAIEQAQHFVATGEGWRQQFDERWKVPPGRVTVIENGSEIVDILEKSALRAFVDVREQPDRVTVVYLGSLEPWHGLNTLVSAMADALKRGAPVQLLLIGSGSRQNEIESLVCRAGIEEHVSFLGHLTPQEYAGYLASADIGVSPYCGRVEYSGLKLLDYKAAGLATIASGANGQPAVILHGRTGWIVPPCSIEALSEALVKLSSDDDLRTRLGQAARIEAEDCHSWRHTALQLEALLLRVAQR